MVRCENDVISYTPTSLFRRDGYAVVRYDGSARDTFDVNDTRLNDEELATGTVLFNLDDFEERPYLPVEDYRAEDVHVIPTRKGMNHVKYLRRGAVRLSESEAAKRHRELRAAKEARARAELLSPAEHQELVSSPMPRMTIEETTELIEIIQWVQRASREFQRALGHVIRVQDGGEGNLLFAVTVADEDHYELYRARRALDSKLEALRG